MSGNANIGIGVAIGIVAIAAAFSLGIAVYLSHERARLDHEQLEQQREELRARQRQEQQRWRERRLRDVVLLLIERGDAAEGIPLAVQMPGRREVSCRRQVRQLHRDPEREHLEEELREEAEAALPAVVRATLHMPLSELLAHGRPVDAAPGPDIMQMLLDGQEPTQLSVSESESEGEWTDSVPASSSSPLPAGATLPVATTTTATTHAAGNTTTTTSSVPPTPAPQPPLGEDAHAIWQEERRAAILHELQIERQRAQRRRRTADEVYGEGYDYLINPNNKYGYDNVAGGGSSNNNSSGGGGGGSGGRGKSKTSADLLRRAYSSGNVRATTADGQAMSPLRRLFATPGSPFRGRKRATMTTSSSAFDQRDALPRCATLSSSPVRPEVYCRLQLQQPSTSQPHETSMSPVVNGEHAFATTATATMAVSNHHGVVESVTSQETTHTPY